MDNNSINEQLLYNEAKKWLNENGKLKVSYLEVSHQYKVVFTSEQKNIEFIGGDTKRLTIQIYNEVKN